MKKTVMVMMVVLGIGISQGYVLTFDDISTSDSGLIFDSYNYGGFDWLPPSTGWAFYYMKSSVFPDSGFANGIVSGNYVAFPSTYDPAGIGGLISSDSFTFNGAYFTAAWRDGLNIQVDGYLEEEIVYTTTIVVGTTSPTWFNFNYAGIDEIRFVASGGTHHEGYEYDNTHFAIDNFTYVPEPTTLLLLTLGAFGIRGINV